MIGRGAGRRRGAVALVLAAALTVAGCDSTDGTGSKGYISGDGRAQIFDEADRGAPIDFEGEDLDGRSLSLADSRGQVTVVNVWWSGCPPCRTEMPELVAVAENYQGKAAFVGINIRDASAGAAQSFVRRFEVPYPSFYDPSGAAVQAFGSAVSARTIPTTVILDEKGRVAAIVHGPVPSARTLTGLIDDAAIG